MFREIFALAILAATTLPAMGEVSAQLDVRNVSLGQREELLDGDLHYGFGLVNTYNGKLVRSYFSSNNEMSVVTQDGEVIMVSGRQLNIASGGVVLNSGDSLRSVQALLGPMGFKATTCDEEDLHLTDEHFTLTVHHDSDVVTGFKLEARERQEDRVGTYERK